jgi:ubiquinone/menaquinone biosynthesis C-methylase UbiE
MKDSAMDRHIASQLAHRDHPVAAPVNDASVQRLLTRAIEPETRRVLDLGCGSGEWLIRLLTRYPTLEAVGVDVSAAALSRAADSVQTLGVRDRLTLHNAEAHQFQDAETFDLVLCVAATHAFGGLQPTLNAASRHLAGNGRVLLGEGYWQRAPTPEAVEILGAR